MTQHSLQKIRSPRQFGFVDAAILLVLGGSVIAAITLLDNVPQGENINVDYERWKVTTQFVWTAIIGGFVGLLYRIWERSASLREARRKIAMEFFDSFSKCHSNYKKSRRVLRSHAKRNDFAIPTNIFEKAISDLNDTQLECENLKRQADVLCKIYRRDKINWAHISHDLWRIESYLNNVVKEANEFSTQAGRCVLEKNTKVGIFIDDSEMGVEENLFSVADGIRERLIEIMTERSGSLH